MAVTIEHVTFDCADAAELAGFWAQVVDRPVDAGSNEFFATVGRAGEALVPVLMFIKVPEERAGKNRLHLDLASSDWAAELDRLAES